jgi:hypothetical protein
MACYATHSKQIYRYITGNERMAVFGRLVVPGTAVILKKSFFFFIIFSNFMGLFPYIFTAFHYNNHMALKNQN